MIHLTEFRSFRAEAIVLRHRNMGEADRLLTLYTREQGKVRAIAKGARKIDFTQSGTYRAIYSRDIATCEGA